MTSFVRPDGSFYEAEEPENEEHPELRDDDGVCLNCVERVVPQGEIICAPCEIEAASVDFAAEHVVTEQSF